MTAVQSPNSGEKLYYFVPGELLIFFQHEEQEDETADPVSGATWERLRKIILDVQPNIGENMPDSVPINVISFEKYRVSRFTQRLSLVRVSLGDVSGDNLHAGELAVLDVIESVIKLEPITVENVTLLAITPNWFSAVVGSGVTEGGPGGPPQPPNPVPPDIDVLTAMNYQVDNTASASAQAEQQKIRSTMNNRRFKQNEVEVFVLDTVPKEEVLMVALQNYPDHIVLNRLFRQAPRPTITYSTELRSQPDFDFAVSGARYRMPDHGLFIAGTIASLAPNANIHLVEVLSPWGVGTLASALEGLQHVADYRSAGRTTIVNCSFVVTVPLVEEHFQANLASERMAEFFRQHTIHDEDYQLKANGTRKRYSPQKSVETWALLPLVEVLRLFLPEAREAASPESLIASLKNQGVVIFAAAGNNGTDDKHPPALYPAAQHEVFGVGALEIKAGDETNPNADMARYTNLSDEPLTAGFLTYGGIMGDEMIGIYLHNFPNGDPSEGWAKWMGTSFATGVMSGMTALMTAHYGLSTALKILVDSKKEPPDRPNHVRVKQKP